MLYAAILFVLSVLPVYAGTGQSEQDGISVSYTTDKEQYHGTDEITAKMTAAAAILLHRGLYLACQPI